MAGKHAAPRCGMGTNNTLQTRERDREEGKGLHQGELVL